MNAPQVTLQNVSKKMAQNTALKNISAVFDAACVHGVIGPNGAGKTTLMRLLAGLLRQDGGRINFSGAANAAAAKEFIGYFPQEPSLYPDLSCDEHLAFFATLYGLPAPVFKERKEQLYLATGMGTFRARPAGKLSGGMYKKLGLMCVLLNRPSLLLLDEPTVGVDPVSRRQLWDLVYSFAADNMTVIVTTSYMDEAARCAKVHILRDGQMPASGSPKDIMLKFKVKDFADIFLDGGGAK